MNKMESIYSNCMNKLMESSFDRWDAYSYGVIDEQGNKIADTRSVRELASFTPFHESVLTLKQRLEVYGNSRSFVDLQEVKASWENLTDKYGVPEITLESMVAGDSGGSVSNIASGVTTGSVTSQGPTGKKVVRRKIKSPLQQD